MRSITDLQALAMAELSGAERRGTVVAELTGSPIPVDSDDVAVSALLKLAEKLGVQGGVQVQIKAYAAAARRLALNKQHSPSCGAILKPTWPRHASTTKLDLGMN